MNYRKYIFILLTLSTVLAFGCSKKPEAPKPKKTLSKAHIQFNALLKDEYGLKSVVVTELDNTLWIYLPLEESFLDIKASEQGPSTSKEAKEAVSIKYLDTQYQDNQFVVEYEIGPSRNYPSSYGYSSSFSKDYQEKQRQVLTAITRAYANVDETDNGFYESIDGDIKLSDEDEQKKRANMIHGHVKTARVPDFFVLVIADIVKGIETKTTLAFSDLKRAAHDQFFQEEYRKRIISSYPTGDQAIIGDMQGTHVKYHDITWPEFIADQISYRVKFTYEQSSKEVTDDVQTVLLKSAREATYAYEFKDFNAVTLSDLFTQTQKTVGKSELENLHTPEDLKKSEGRLINIQFR